eukprot:8025763-Karenia_brevis.AAC.1
MDWSESVDMFESEAETLAEDGEDWQMLNEEEELLSAPQDESEEEYCGHTQIGSSLRVHLEFPWGPQGWGRGAGPCPGICRPQTFLQTFAPSCVPLVTLTGAGRRKQFILQ